MKHLSLATVRIPHAVLMGKIKLTQCYSSLSRIRRSYWYDAPSAYVRGPLHPLPCTASSNESRGLQEYQRAILDKWGLTVIDNALFKNNAIGQWAAISYQYERVFERSHKVGNQLEHGMSIGHSRDKISN
jgi:hypothetical protein